MNLTPEILVPRLGDALIEQGLLHRADLDKALDRQKQLRKSGQVPLIGQLLVEMGFITRETLDQAITDQILKLHSALQEANTNLELKVKRRTAELEIAYKKLSELSELKSNFVSNISHELRTPLTHIQGYIDLFLATDEYDFDDEVRNGLAVMQRSTERLNNLINDLILFTTSEIGTIQLNKQAFDLKKVADRYNFQFKSAAELKGISLLYECRADEVVVLADEQRISWVINQLLDNAVKYSGKNDRIKLIVAQDHNDAVITIEDTGIGFDPSQLDEVFEPFHQLDGSSTRKHGGTGIGLALAKRMIEAHDSMITVKSKPGKGSKFEFRLPIASKTE